jgi:hypothetical protein
MALCLYAIVGERPRAPLGKGMSKQPLSLLRVGKAWVVVETAAPRAPSISALVAYDRIVRRIARRSSAVLPLRFASTAANEREARELVAARSVAVARAFDRVRGMVQLSLRVTGVPAPEAEPSPGAGPGTRWLARRAARERAPEISALTEATRPFVREARVERAATAAKSGRRRGPIASVYHLVAREDLAAWRAAFARAAPELEATVSVTGPWPPYAFAELA